MFVRSARMVYLRVHDCDDDDLATEMIAKGLDAELGFHAIERDIADTPARPASKRRSVVVRLAARRSCGDLLGVKNRVATLQASLLEMRIDDVARRGQRSCTHTRASAAVFGPATSCNKM